MNFKTICFLLLFAIFFVSCEKYFLQKPETTGTTTSEKVFSSFVDAQNAVSHVYHEALKQGLPHTGAALNLGTLGSLAGETSRGWSWQYGYAIINNGMSASGYSEDDYSYNYVVIRKCYLIKENIDKVKDMSDADKKNVKYEMDALIAYRYMNMFIRYGGVPIVRSSLSSEDDLHYPRATLEETKEFILSLIDGSINNLPDTWTSQWKGRMTKGAALAIKAKTLAFSARTLFNSSVPYVNFGEYNSLISFQSYEGSRWQEVINACNELLVWCEQNNYELINTGNMGRGEPNPNAFEDYGTATSQPGNKEVLLAFKVNKQSNISIHYNISAYATLSSHEPAMAGMHTNFLENYYTENGQSQVWPGVGAGNSRPGADYLMKIVQLEPRFQVDNKPHGLDALNNKGDQGWATERIGLTVNRGGAYGKGVAFSTKFFYKAGSRTWFDFPIFRLAEFYLTLAEAYNEIDDTNKALEMLNVVHNRAGLPAINERDKLKLKNIIQREWAVEYYNENQRYFLLKHWRHSEIDQGLIGGARREFQFTTNEKASWLPESFLTYYDEVVFNAYWSPSQFLHPFPQEEVNKGDLIQNPNY